MEVRPQHLDALYVVRSETQTTGCSYRGGSGPLLQKLRVPPVDLLVLGVRSIVGRSQRQQHDVPARSLLEGQGHWDASSFTGQVRLHTKH